MKKVFPSIMIFLGISFGIFSQEASIHPPSKEYQWPDEARILSKLDQWQDLKFGIIIHLGLYTVPGVIESEELCLEDWINRPDSRTYVQYKRWYWGLTSMILLSTGQEVKWAIANDDVIVTLPSSFGLKNQGSPTLCFEFTPIN